MVEDDLMYRTLIEVYENHCSRNNREADLPITKFKEQPDEAISGQISAEVVEDLCLQTYNDMTKICDRQHFVLVHVQDSAQWKPHVGFQEAIYH